MLKALFKQIRINTVLGILYSWKLFIPIIFVLFAMCIRFSVDTHVLLSLSPTTFDFFIEIFKGMKIYNPKNLQEMFQIPFFYLLFNWYISYLVSKLSLSSLHGSSNSVFYARKRNVWWYGRCILCAEIVFVCYLVVYIVIFAASLLFGRFSFDITSDIASNVSKITFLNQNMTSIFISAFLMPFIVSLSLSFFQLNLALIFSKASAHIVVIVILTISAYYCSCFFIGNFSMLYRNNIVTNNGVSNSIGLILCCMISIASILFGKIKFNRFDILN